MTRCNAVGMRLVDTIRIGLDRRPPAPLPMPPRQQLSERPWYDEYERYEGCVFLVDLGRKKGGVRWTG